MGNGLTKKEIVREVVKAGKDPVYFTTSYCRISHPQRGLIPFKAYDYQQDLLKDFNDYRFNIILKARQLGISTITAAYIAWLMLFHRDKSILVVATKLQTATNLVKKVKAIIKNLPSWLRISEITVDNRTSFELSNGSQIKSSSTSGDAGRSEALSLLVIDEAAHVDKLSDLWTALYPTLSTGGRCIALSTPNGVGNWFHQSCVEAEAGTNDFYMTTLLWNVHPDRDKKWFEKETKNMSTRQIAQELECVRAGTRIITPDGFKTIEEIEIGDHVLTHKGRFKKVVRLFNKIAVKEDMTKVSLPMSRKSPIYMTKNHPTRVMIKKEQKGQSIYNFLKRGEVKKEWASFGELEERYGEYQDPQYLNAVMPALDANVLTGDLKRLDLSKYPYTKNLTADSEYVRYFRQKGQTNRWADVDYDLGRIVGLYLSEGNKTENRVQFSFHRDEEELINFVTEYATAHGMRAWIDERTYSKCTVVLVNNKFLSSILDEFVSGNNCYTKRLTGKIYETNKNFIKGIVDGTWQGDGYHHPKKKNCLVMANEGLIYQVRLLMTMFGLLTRVSYHHKNGVGGSWYLELNNVDGKLIEECTKNGLEPRQGQRCKIHDRNWWGRTRLEEPIELDESTVVYNIEVEEDNSYVCENLVVHNCNFNVSGETVIHPDDIQWYLERACAPQYRTGFDRNYWIWKKHDSLKPHLIVADVARGDGKDNSAFHIFELETMEVVAEYVGKPTPDEFADILYGVAAEYGNPMLVIENNNIGYAVLKKLLDKGYSNLYHSRKGDHQYIDPVSAQWQSNVIPGFTTSSKTRPLIIAKMEEFMRNKLIKINSNRLLSEMKTFIWHSGRPQAMRSYNDDLVMSFAIGCWVRDTVIVESQKEIEYSRQFLSAISTSETKISTTIPGMTNHKTTKDSQRSSEAANYNKMYEGLIKG